METKKIQQLCADIETAVGQRMCTPKDFTLLHERIYNRLGIMISPTTLKRIWGYLSSDYQASHSSLSILARFLGYRGWEDYLQREAEGTELPSSPVMSRRLTTEELRLGSELRLTWQPNRVCIVRYEGKSVFRVLSSENTRLREGDTFRCGLFIEGEPLYIDDWTHDTQPPVAYVCGKRSGIRYEIIKKMRVCPK